MSYSRKALFDNTIGHLSYMLENLKLFPVQEQVRIKEISEAYRLRGHFIGKERHDIYYMWVAHIAPKDEHA